MTVKFSAIAAAGAIAGTDTIIGVQSGTTDVQYTISALKTFITNNIGGGPAILTSPSAAVLQLGAADVDTAPVAQGLRTQGTLTGGTNNVAGANFTLAISPGKGNQPGGSFIVQVAPFGGSGNTPNTLVNALAIAADKSSTFSGNLVIPSGGTITGGSASITIGATQILPTGDIVQAAAATLFWSGRVSFISGGAAAMSVRNSSSTLMFDYGATTASALTVTGSLSITALANAATTSAVCYNTGTGVVTYNSTIGTCTVSTIDAKNLTAQMTPEEGLGIVLKLKPWWYTLKENRPTSVSGEQMGLIAEQALNVEPRMVAVDDDGTVAGVRYEQYTAALTAAFQHLNARVQQLELQ